MHKGYRLVLYSIARIQQLIDRVNNGISMGAVHHSSCQTGSLLSSHHSRVYPSYQYRGFGPSIAVYGSSFILSFIGMDEPNKYVDGLVLTVVPALSVFSCR
mmetsp:Transcript_2658/g.3036  ORF Transcript_2658/g.3036 Transcript_2658/m.3036 type:complete len:101 (-) Transcript_2658:786-1088(-)